MNKWIFYWLKVTFPNFLLVYISLTRLLLKISSLRLSWNLKWKGFYIFATIGKTRPTLIKTSVRYAVWNWPDIFSTSFASGFSRMIFRLENWKFRFSISLKKLLKNNSKQVGSEPTSFYIQATKMMMNSFWSTWNPSNSGPTLLELFTGVDQKYVRVKLIMDQIS